MGPEEGKESLNNGAGGVYNEAWKVVSITSAHVPVIGTQACGLNLTAGEKGKCGFPAHSGRSSPADEHIAHPCHIANN